MIMITKEQLADLLREAYAKGADDSGGFWNDQDHFESSCGMAIQPLVHRSSCGHDDHGREVK